MEMIKITAVLDKEREKRRRKTGVAVVRSSLFRWSVEILSLCFVFFVPSTFGYCCCVFLYAVRMDEGKRI